MNGQTRQPAPQGISALLRKAGFERAVITRQYGRGLGKDHTAGYHVKLRPGHAGEVVVNWWPSTSRPNTYSAAYIEGDAATAKDMHQRYAEAIRSAGWGAEVTRLNVRVYALPESAPETTEGAS
jgi:hypothetical protein